MNYPFTIKVLEVMSIVKYFIDQETGLLVSLNNLEEFSNSIVSLIDRKLEFP